MPISIDLDGTPIEPTTTTTGLSTGKDITLRLIASRKPQAMKDLRHLGWEGDRAATYGSP